LLDISRKESGLYLLFKMLICFLSLHSINNCLHKTGSKRCKSFNFLLLWDHVRLCHSLTLRLFFYVNSFTPVDAMSFWFYAQCSKRTLGASFDDTIIQYLVSIVGIYRLLLQLLPTCLHLLPTCLHLLTTYCFCLLSTWNHKSNFSRRLQMNSQIFGAKEFIQKRKNKKYYWI